MSRADEEDRFLYGSTHEYPPGEEPSHPPRSRSRSRDRRRSRSRSPRSSRRREDSDKDWKKSTDAFLNNLGAKSPQNSHAPVTYPGMPQHGYASAYASSMNAPPPSRYGSSTSYPQDSRDSRDSRRRSPDDRKYGNGNDDRSRGRDEQRRSQDRNPSEHSEGLKEEKAMITREQREKLVDQREHYAQTKGKMENNLLKLKEQREVLKEKGAKHEDAVMKENARFQKEIKAGIQKVVDMLAQIDTHLALPDAPSSPVPRKRHDQDRSPTPEQREPEKKKAAGKRRERSESPGDADTASKETEKEKTKKKKKKKNKDRGSSSDDDSEVEKEKKKKKKKKKKKHQSSSSDSGSDSERDSKSKKSKKGDTDDFAKEVEESKKSKKSDETLVDLLAKMSEAFMKSKQEVTELKHRIQALESENIVLKKQNKEYRKTYGEIDAKNVKEEKRSNVLQEAQMLLSGKVKSEKECSPPQEEKRQVKRLTSPPAPLAGQNEKEREDREREERQRQREEERERVHREREQREKEEREAREKERDKEREKEREQERERERNRDKEKEGGDRRQDDRERERERDGGDRRHDDRGDRRREYDRRSPSPRSRRYEGRDGRYDRGDRFDNRHDDRRHSDDRRDRFRDPRERERSREKSYSRYDESFDRKRDYRSNEREARDPKSRDRNDRINLDDWQKPEEKPKEKIDPTLAAIRAKILEKESKFREEHHREQAKKGWAMVQTPIPLPESPKHDRSRTPEESKLPEVREQVNIQWGTSSAQKKASTPGPEGKKSQPVIGKMPGRGLAKKSTPTPQGTDEPTNKRAKYTGYAPGTLPAGPVGSQYYGRLDQAGMTPEMYVQAITATMPDGPPEEPVLPAHFAPIMPAAPPKHPTPTTMDIGTILAAAKQHINMKKDQFGFVTRAQEQEKPKRPELGIPLPPLPAATDKDDLAHVDTRPPKAPTPPPPPPPKTELDEMLEKHATKDDTKPANGTDEGAKKPAGFGGNEEMDPDELAMLGIDPSDFDGFGK